MPERRGYHLLIPGVDHCPRLLVRHPGLDGGLLDPDEGPLRSPVMSGNVPLIAAHQGEQRGRFGSGQGEIAARRRGILPSRSRRPSCRPRRYRPGPRQPEHFSALARPGPRFPRCARVIPWRSSRPSRSSRRPATASRSCRSTLTITESSAWTREHIRCTDPCIEHT